MGSYMFGHPPFFSSADYEHAYTSKHNLDASCDSTGQCSSSLIDVISSKISSLPEAGIIREELNSILAEMHLLNQDLQRNSGRPYSEHHLNHIIELRRGIELGLFGLLYEDSSTLYAFEYAYILALQLYFNRVFRTFRRGWKLPTNLASRLRRALLEINLEDGKHQWEQVSSLLLWASFVGGASCSSGPLRMWYIAFSSYISNRIGLNTWEKENDVLKDRLYPSGDLSKRFREFWNDRSEYFSDGVGLEIVWPGRPTLVFNNSSDDQV
jgi:hypothetical protein